MTIADRIEDDLRADEGFRAFVYDDATGQPIVKGSIVKGYASIGFGFCIDAIKGAPLPRQIADAWLQRLVDERWAQLKAALPWILTQPDDVQVALGNMAYQLGVEGVLGFKLMLAALQRNDRESAAIAALNSTWHTQTPARAERVATLIRGHEPEDA